MTLPYFNQEASTDIDFQDVEAFPTVVQKVTDHPMSDMATVFDSTFTALFPVLEENGIKAIGPGFSLHHRMPGETATFEVGIPVDKPLSAAITTDAGVTLVPSELPAGSVASISYLGGYDGLGDAWGAFMDEVAKSGKQSKLPFWEIYVTEPTPDIDPAVLRTDLVTLVTG